MSKKEFEEYPTLVGYTRKSGKYPDLEKQIKDEVTDICRWYIEVSGGQIPDRKLILSWMSRLKRAYHTGKVIQLEFENER